MHITTIKWWKEGGDKESAEEILSINTIILN
jgi:hypothetical protein